MTDVKTINPIYPSPEQAFSKEESAGLLSTSSPDPVEGFRAVKLRVLTACVLALFFTLTGLVFLEAVYMESKKESLRKEITARIDAIFGGKQQVLDGRICQTLGYQKDVRTRSGVKFRGRSNRNSSSFSEDSWERRSRLATVFYLELGGFTFTKLTKLGPEAFERVTTTSSDLGFLEPIVRQSDYTTEINLREPVQWYYQEAFNFLTRNEGFGAYTPGKLSEITDFAHLQNEYYSIKNMNPTRAGGSGLIFSGWSSEDHTNAFTWDLAKVYYSLQGLHFELVLDAKKYAQDRMLLFRKTGVVLVYLLVAFGVAKPRFLRSLNLYGKTWKNISVQDAFLFTHAFWGKGMFTQTRNNVKIHGTFCITSRGKKIRLIYPDADIFFTIEKLSSGRLTLRPVASANELLVYAAG